MFTIGDQDVYLVGGMRLLDGQMIYRDFFDFLPPGTHLVYFALFKLFGVRAWIPNVMLIVLGVGLTWLTVVISRRIVRGTLAFLPGLIFLTFSFRLQLDATHHWYSALAVLAALAVVVEAHSPGRLAAAGALCGLAAFFTQTRGAMAVLGLAVYLVWEARKKKLSWGGLLKNEIYLFAGFLLTTCALFAYFIDRAGLSRVVDCTVSFLLKYSTAYWWNTWAVYLVGRPTYHPWYRLVTLAAWAFMNVFQPVVYVLCLRRYRRESGEPAEHPRIPWDRWMLLYIVGLFLLLGSVRAPNSLRLAADSFPALILLVWLMDSPGWFSRAVRTIFWSAALSLALLTSLTRQVLYTPRYLDLPTGRTAFFDPDWIAHYEWFLARTRPGDYFFGSTSFNFYLRLRNPVEVPFLTSSDFTRPEQVRSTIGGLERHQVRFVLWWADLDLPDPSSPQGDHLGPIRAYLREHYRVTESFPDGEVWERQH